MPTQDPFNARKTLDTPLGQRTIYDLGALSGLGDVDRLPYSIKVLLEACLRNVDGFVVSEDHVKALAGYDAKNVPQQEIPYKPGRVVLQDFTGVPAVVDLAAMREGMVRLTGDKKQAQKVNPQVPCDLVIDHSVQVDAFNSAEALKKNSEKEFERNLERYEFLKWGQKALDNFRVVPPATGIVHQVNLEYLGRVVWDGKDVAGQENVLYPDSLVGTDSHTTMINGLGICGWGVGGIEAEAVMLGQPIYMLMPEVVGFKFTGELSEGCTATDLVLRVTEILREHGVVGKFVEFHGPGLANMPVANRATIANMAPEYGATMGFFPVDEQTLNYMQLTGREQNQIDTVEQYCKAQGLWRDDKRDVTYADELELDLSTVEPALAGPKRPQDRIALSAMKDQWQQDLSLTFGKHSPGGGSTVNGYVDEGGAAATSPAATAIAEDDTDGVEVDCDGQRFRLGHGDVVIAAITSCTNTSNPGVMLGAGLVAKKAAEKGLGRKPWVKTSLAPGSKVVTDYLEKSGLMDDLQQLGFYLVGYGCTTCIGNSGPLPEPISNAIQENDLVAASVLSGNRNFEGRINPDVKANYLASPPLVVAYAIAGTVDIDLNKEPIGRDQNGQAVYLRDIWPTQAEIEELTKSSIGSEQFQREYADVFEGSDEWKAVDVSGGELYQWDPDSTYIQQPPFFRTLGPDTKPIPKIENAKVLAMVGDSVTTDHISPAGAIKKDSPAGQFLQASGVEPHQFNSYGSRRGNDRVMVRGTFANIRVRNQLAPGTEGGWTTYLGKPQAGAERSEASDQSAPDAPAVEPVKPGETTTIFNASVHYGLGQTSEEALAPREDGTPLVVLAGKDYGMGSSRDWAAKGTYLLGVRAVIATSFERIHRSNLVGMGVLPLQFKQGEDRESLGLTGEETFDIAVDDSVAPSQTISVTATKPDGQTINFDTTCRLDTPVEIDYYRNGGILHKVLRDMAKA
jgi:aconitate hydratase